MFSACCCVFTVILFPKASYILTKYSQLIWLRFKQLAWHPSHEGSAENKFNCHFYVITRLTSHPLMNLCCTTQCKTNRTFSNGDLKIQINISSDLVKGCFSVWEVKLNKHASKHTSSVSQSHIFLNWSYFSEFISFHLFEMWISIFKACF